MEWNRENRKLESSNVVVNGGGGSVFYKPSKLYAVRYLDEIIVMTSGTKFVTVGLKKQVIEFWEEDLELDVDRGMTVIHSVVSEKVGYLVWRFGLLHLLFCAHRCLRRQSGRGRNTLGRKK